MYAPVEAFKGVEERAASVRRPTRLGHNLLLYIHIPFCTAKCSFCAWVAPIAARDVRSGREVRAKYVEAVIAQIAEYGPRLTSLGYVPRYVYWGGGTPSILSASETEALGEAFATYFDLAEVREYSVESSPETLSVEKLKAFRKVGMNRLSIGVQSFDDSELQRAGRAHSAGDARRAVNMAKDVVPGNLNIDLISGFPRQTQEMLLQSVRDCIELGPEHVTVYPYVPIQGTVMFRQIVSDHLPISSVRERASLHSMARTALIEAGYEEYMPNYFALEQSKRFLAEKYYFLLEGDYIGFGSGAHSRVAHHWLLNKRGNLAQFLSSPTLFDVCMRFTPNATYGYGEAVSLVLSRGHRLSLARFREAFGFAFEQLDGTEFLDAWTKGLKASGQELVRSRSEVYIGPSAN